LVGIYSNAIATAAPTMPALAPRFNQRSDREFENDSRVRDTAQVSQ
jgi:hypothetical protein